MKKWFIADTHFSHKNILDFEKRPFNSLEEMQEKMIAAWNATVGKLDTVYVVGDFCFGNHKNWIEILDQLRGEIILIKGNHDKSKIINRVHREGYLKEVHQVGTILKEENFLIHLTHYPLALGDRPRSFNVSGHIHAEENDQLCQINVGVDSFFMRNYYFKERLPFGSPVSFEYLIETMKQRNEVLEKTYVRGV